MTRKLLKALRLVAHSVRRVRESPGPHQNQGTILDYWRRPNDGHNDPRNYVVSRGGHARSQRQVDLVSGLASPGSTIIELGCNVGRNLNYLFQVGFTRLTGGDINGDALELLGETYPDMAAAAELRLGAPEDVVPTLPAHSCDVVFTMAVLQHVHPDSEWLFAGIARIARSFVVIWEVGNYQSERHFPRNDKSTFSNLGLTQTRHTKGFRVFRK